MRTKCAGKTSVGVGPWGQSSSHVVARHSGLITGGQYRGVAECLFEENKK